MFGADRTGLKFLKTQEKLKVNASVLALFPSTRDLITTGLRG